MYLGRLDNRGRPGGLPEKGVQQRGKSSLDVSEQKQRGALLITQPSKIIAQSLTMPGPNPSNTQYGLRFHLTGLPVPKVSISSTILEFLLPLT